MSRRLQLGSEQCPTVRHSFLCDSNTNLGTYPFTYQTSASRFWESGSDWHDSSEVANQGLIITGLLYVQNHRVRRILRQRISGGGCFVAFPAGPIPASLSLLRYRPRD